jgi:uncharacterized damage-inducible protein DinB
MVKPATGILRDSLEEFRSTRTRTVALVDKLTQAQMDYAPATGRWSVGEVLDHLILAQRLNLGYLAEVIEMKEAGEQPVLRLNFRDLNVSLGYIPRRILPALEVPFRVLNVFIPDSMRGMMMRHRLIPAQNPDVTTPRRARPADELRNDLVSSFDETEALLESNAHLDYDEMVIQHPLLGTHKVLGLLRFLALHEERHQSQIHDILRSSQFPAGPPPTTPAGAGQ